LSYILGVLNSRAINFFYSILNPEQGEALAEVKKNHVEQLPIPTATPGEQAAIASKVEQILAAKAHDPAAEVSTLEREIDELVADLYGLDDAEKQLVGLE
jgi:hypothetical protein